MSAAPPGWAANGILTFMLTPGRWLATHALIDGFFNPTMVPSLVAYVGPFRHPRSANALVASILLVLGLGATGATEWVREAVRKPYVIYNHMYSNAIRQADRVAIGDRGILQAARWVDVQASGHDQAKAAAAIFRVECRSRHTIDGYNAVRPLVRKWSEPFIDYQLQRLDEVKGYMPPFSPLPVQPGGVVADLAPPAVAPRAEESNPPKREEVAR